MFSIAASRLGVFRLGAVGLVFAVLAVVHAVVGLASLKTQSPASAGHSPSESVAEAPGSSASSPPMLPIVKADAHPAASPALLLQINDDGTVSVAVVWAVKEQFSDAVTAVDVDEAGRLVVDALRPDVGRGTPPAMRPNTSPGEKLGPNAVAPEGLKRREPMKIEEWRKQPEMRGLDDASIVRIVHQTFYPDLEPELVAESMGVKLAAPPRR